jgi:hypothetical protein
MDDRICVEEEAWVMVAGVVALGGILNLNFYEIKGHGNQAVGVLTSVTATINADASGKTTWCVVEACCR